jgi:hypothetical protein
MKRIACNGIGIVLLLSLLGLVAGAQNQSAASNQTTSSAQSSTSGGSLGDYARQVRKDSAAKARPKVFDNDNLPTDDKLSIVGSSQTTSDNSSDAKADESASTPSTESKTATDANNTADTKPAGDAKTAADKTPAPPATLPEDEAGRQAAIKQWSNKISSEKDQIDTTERELNILQREYQIRAAAMYGDVGNRLRNSSDWDKQDAQYKQQIADKQKALDDARQKLEDTQEDARKAGVPESEREQ